MCVWLSYVVVWCVNASAWIYDVWLYGFVCLFLWCGYADMWTGCMMILRCVYDFQMCLYDIEWLACDVVMCVCMLRVQCPYVFVGLFLCFLFIRFYDVSVRLYCVCCMCAMFVYDLRMCFVQVSWVCMMCGICLSLML